MILRLGAIKLTFQKRKTKKIHEMDENDTKLTNFETTETENIKSKSNVILFSDYTPSDILGIVRVSLIGLRGGPIFDSVKYVKEVSHGKHVHADLRLVHPNFSSKFMIT